MYMYLFSTIGSDTFLLYFLNFRKLHFLEFKKTKLNIKNSGKGEFREFKSISYKFIKK